MTEFDTLFRAAGVDGWLHALDLASGREIAHGADEPVVAASVFKIPVLVEMCRQADAGEIDLAEQVTLPVAGRAPGPTGLSMGLDASTLSWRDMALSMIVVSDNAATDVLCDRLGIARIRLCASWRLDDRDRAVQRGVGGAKARKARPKGRRASVPSWDEILFGASRGDDA